mgnify:CR=1 FL=1
MNENINNEVNEVNNDLIIISFKLNIVISIYLLHSYYQYKFVLTFVEKKIKNKLVNIRKFCIYT